MLDEWEMLYLGTGIVMCRRITTDTMSDPSSVHDGHGALGTTGVGRSRIIVSVL